MEKNSEKTVIRLGEDFLLQALPPRSATAHKGTFGRLLMLCGSRAYRGAATLSVGGALCCGAGVVQLASIETVCAAVAAYQPCCTFLRMNETPVGGISASSLEDALAQKPAAILAGCGLGNTAYTAELVEQLLSNAESPLVLDADALNVLCGRLDTGVSDDTAKKLGRAFGGAKRPIVITPHIGEMARLCGLSPAEVQNSQLKTAVDYAARHNCVVVLKSHFTVVAAPGGQVAINDEAGNAGMAKAGSGDVLAGMVAGLIAQGLEPFTAAAAGVWLHAAAGDAAAREMGLYALSPASLPQYAGRVLQRMGL